MNAKLADSWVKGSFRENDTHTHTRPRHVSPVVPEFHVYPVSNLEQRLKMLAINNACVAPDTARKKRFKLLRDIAAVEKSLDRHLTPEERMNVFDLWYSTSLPHLDPKKGRDHYLAKFFAEAGKVRVPAGEGEALKKALERLSTVSLPQFPGACVYPESWHKVAALHRELARQSANGTYFLSCRGAAKADSTLNKDSAASINLALDQIGIIERLRVGTYGKASEYRYLLPLEASESPTEAFVDSPVLSTSEPALLANNLHC